MSPSKIYHRIKKIELVCITIEDWLKKRATIGKEVTKSKLIKSWWLLLVVETRVKRILPLLEERWGKRTIFKGWLKQKIKDWK